MLEENPLCLVRDLKVSIKSNVLLSDLNLVIEKGDPFAIVGSSGAGKTTLLHSLTGLIHYDVGEIFYSGNNLRLLSLAERANYFGLVFQDYQLFPHLTILDNLKIAFDSRNIPLNMNDVLQLIDELNIIDFLNRYPFELSGGQKQRVAIGRSLLLKPKILFLDEPSAALDDKTSKELALLLRRLNRHTQIVVVSHDRPFLNEFIGDGIRLEQGKIIQAGPLPSLFERN